MKKTTKTGLSVVRREQCTRVVGSGQSTVQIRSAYHKSVEAIEGYQRWSHKCCDSNYWGQRGLSIKQVDQWPRLNYHITLAYYKGMLTNGMRLMQYVIATSCIVATPWSKGQYIRHLRSIYIYIYIYIFRPDGVVITIYNISRLSKAILQVFSMFSCIFKIQSGISHGP